VRRVSYRNRLSRPTAKRCARARRLVLASTEAWAERTRPFAAQINLRPYVEDLRILPDSLEWTSLSPQAARPARRLLRLLGLGDLLASGAVLERTKFRTHDESSHLETVKGKA